LSESLTNTYILNSTAAINGKLFIVLVQYSCVWAVRDPFMRPSVSFCDSCYPNERSIGIHFCSCVCVCVCCLRPDGIGTVSVEEKEHFEEIKERLRVLLENQITHFRCIYCQSTQHLIIPPN